MLVWEAVNIKMKIWFSENSWTNARNILIIIIIFHCINNLFWFKNDGYVQHGSHSVWLEKRSFDYSRILFNNRMPVLEKVANVLDSFKLDHNGYDSYAFSVTNSNLTSFFIAFPISTRLNGHMKLFLIKAILFSQFLLVLFAIYYLGKTVFNQTIGAWSSIIFSFYPGIFGLSRKVNTELMVAFFVILSIIVFLRWKYFPKILGPFLLFVVFALGVFSGSLFIVFFVPLFLLHLFTIFSYKGKIGSLFQLIIFSCFILLFFNFYFNGEYLKVFLNLKEGLNEAYQKLFFRSTNFIGSADKGVIGSFLFASQDSVCPCTQTTNVGMNVKTFFFYIMEMMYYTSTLFFLLGISSFSFLLRDKGVDFYKRMFFRVWVIFSYLLLSLFHIKWGKFITPILPALALSSGIFICSPLKKVNIKKPLILLLGVSTVLYYSYFHDSREHFLETVSEGIISHRPLKSRFVYVAEQIAVRINNEDKYKTARKINIAFLDKDSTRFKNVWVSDTGVKINNLIRLFLKRKYWMASFWSLSDGFYNTLYKRDFLILITHQKIKKTENYLYPEETRKIPNLKFEIAYEDWLREDIFIYLIKILET